MVKHLDERYTVPVMELIRGVVKAMRKTGIDQWDDVYPAENDITEDLKSGTAFGFFDGEELAAYVVLNGSYWPEYDTVNWTVGTNPLIVHRLSVKAEKQGQGIAKKVMLFAEEHARNNNYDVIRLDAFPQNQAALRLYDSLGYKKAGDVYFRKGLFYCYEKEIK